ncbi:hypothetical protein ACHAXM_004613 [Skeletonema potamos]|jgi:hypothetical protein
MVTGLATRALVLVLVSSVEAKRRRVGSNGRRYLGNCSALKGIELRRCLAASEIDLNIPDECTGSSNLEHCIEDYNLKQTILAQHNLESTPKDCEEEDPNSLDACLTELDLIILGISNDTKILTECEGLEEENLKKCIEEHTLSPTSYPISFPTILPTTKPPTLHPIQSPSEAPSGRFAYTTYSFGVKEVVLDIGAFVMSLTTYSQTSREVGILTREHELAAARQHLRETYEDAFHIPVVTVDLQFVDRGLTKLPLSESGSMIQHSTFFGNATFVDEATHSLPTLAQLESATLQAFSGALKEEFIKKYHFLATGSPSYIGQKYRYDVSVRKVSKNEAGILVAATQAIQGIQRVNETPNNRFSEEASGMYVVVMIVFGVVLFGTLIGLAVIVRKKRRDRVSSAQNFHDDFVVEEIDVIGSNVGSDVSLSPQRLLELDDSLSFSEDISHLGLDLSPSDDDDDEKHKVASKCTGDGSTHFRGVSSLSDNDIPYIDVELEMGSNAYFRGGSTLSDEQGTTSDRDRDSL